MKCCETSMYVHGLRIDYLLPKLYVSDLVLMVLLGLVGVRGLIYKSSLKRVLSLECIAQNWLWFAVSGILLLRQLWTAKPLAAGWYVIQVAMSVVAGWYVFGFWKEAKQWQKSIVLGAIGLSVFLQSGLSFYQFWTQHNLLPYQWLGESNLHQGWNIAKATLANGQEYLLPLGTTPHPNILAGLIVISLGLLWQVLPPRKIEQKSMLVLLSVFGMGVLYLARSASAWLAAVFFVIWFMGQRWPTWPKWARIWLKGCFVFFLVSPLVVLTLTTLQPGIPSTERRAYLNKAAITLFFHKPLFGAGLNNFTVWVEDFTEDREVVRFTQPVHHVGLLWLAETGLLGVLWLVVSVRAIWPKVSPSQRRQVFLFLATLTPLLSLDHYLLTQHMGLLLVSLGAGLIAASAHD